MIVCLFAYFLTFVIVLIIKRYERIKTKVFPKLHMKGNCIVFNSKQKHRLRIYKAKMAQVGNVVYLKKQNLSSNPEFQYAQYLESPRNLIGNRYSLKAELEMQLAEVGTGRVVSLRDSNRAKFAVLIPNKLNVNAQTKQRYDMDIVIGTKGEIVVESMKKF